MFQIFWKIRYMLIGTSLQKCVDKVVIICLIHGESRGDKIIFHKPKMDYQLIYLFYSSFAVKRYTKFTK